MGISRRSILTAAAAGAGSTLLSLPGQATIVSAPKVKKAKNIIFCVSDGMSAGVPSMTDHFQRIVNGKSSYWFDLIRAKEVVNSHMDTRSLNSTVTDSAAGASAWGSGVHIINGAVNALPGIKLTPLYRILKQNKMKTALVTTATITHATPSGFAVSNSSRYGQPEIARQYLEEQVDLLMGGGHEFFSPEIRKDKIDVYAEYAKAGYTVCKTRDELMAKKGAQKLLGVFSTGQVPFSIDRDHNETIKKNVPTLAEMATIAIDTFKKSSNGFILQIEGARIDHAAHANDFGALIFDQIAFEEAVKVAVEFARQDGETLVVITSDHGNANPGISGDPAEYGAGNGLVKLMSMKSSYEAMNKELKAAKTAEAVQALMEEKLSVKMTTEQAQTVSSAFTGKNPFSAYHNYDTPTSALGIALCSHTGVGWTSGEHTSDWVILTALGPGAEQFRGLVENIHCFEYMLNTRGLAFKNPTLTLEEARKAAAAAAETHDHEDEEASFELPHWI